MEGELEELNRRKMALTLSVEQLGREESEHRASVEQLADKIKDHRKSFLKITQQGQEATDTVTNWSVQTERRLGAGGGSSGGGGAGPSTTVQFREEGDGKPPHGDERVGPREDQGAGTSGSGGGGDGGGGGEEETQLQESWMARGGRGGESPVDSDTSMDILDLEPPPSSKVHAHDAMGESGRRLLNLFIHIAGKGPCHLTPQVRGHQSQAGETPLVSSGHCDHAKTRISILPLRELCDTLTEEKRSLGKTKAYLSKQQRSLKERQIAWEQTHKQWNEGMKLHQGRKVRKQLVV